MKNSILNLKNNKVGTVDLDKNIFGQKTFDDLFINIFDIKMPNPDRDFIK